MANQHEISEKPAEQAGSKNGASAVSAATQSRFRLASLLRLPDAIVARAVSAYERVFTLDRHEEADIYLKIGTDFAQSRRSEDAVVALKKALEIQPNDAAAWFQLGMAHLGQQAMGASVEAFEKSKSLGNDAFELHFHLAEALADSDRHDDAIRELELAIGQKPDHAEAFYRLGTGLDRVKRYEDAVKAFQRAIELSPRDAAYHQSLGFTLDTMGRRDEAVEHFKRALLLERRAGQPR